MTLSRLVSVLLDVGGVAGAGTALGIMSSVKKNDGQKESRIAKLEEECKAKNEELGYDWGDNGEERPRCYPKSR